MHKVTIKDVAREAGVSISLVSFVMNNTRNAKDGEKKKYSVNEETANKILEVAGRLGYRPNKAASTLRSGRQYTIGVITSDIANHFFSDIARYIENVAYENGYTVLFASTDESDSKTERIVDTFLDNSVDGMIIAPCRGSIPSVQKVIDANIPTVLIDRDIPEARCGKVLLDNFKAGWMAVEHLYRAGYRKIEMFNYTLGISSMAEREIGYRRAMNKYSLDKYVNVKYSTYGCAEQDVMDFVSDAVARGVEAVIFPTNTISVLGLKAIHEFKIEVPRQLAVVCFDNNDSYDLYNPRITRITQSTRDMAFGAFDMLKAIIENPQRSGEARLILEPEMVCRESTAAVEGKFSGPERAFPYGKNDSILLPASAFGHLGGWIPDSQFISGLHSTFLLAHGLGTPVEDASTTFRVLHGGEYNVWVRTRNWTAKWSHGAAPGIFGIMIDGETSGTTFGNGQSDWSWQYGGKVYLKCGIHSLALRDLTGFDGRCDSVLLTLSDERPSDEDGFMRSLRSSLSDVSGQAEFEGHFDFVVYGADTAGICAAAAAARKGLKVALVHDGDILGGDNSSEVRIGLGGRMNAGTFSSLGYMMNEFAPVRGGNAEKASVYEDAKKEDFVCAEKNITVFKGFFIDDLIKTDSGMIDAVVAVDVKTCHRIWLKGELYMDCTPGNRLASLAGGSAVSFSAPDVDAVMFGFGKEDVPSDFPEIKWGLKDQSRDFTEQAGKLCCRFHVDRGSICSAEDLRDFAMLQAYSLWSELKNCAASHDRYLCGKLEWLPWKMKGAGNADSVSENSIYDNPCAALPFEGIGNLMTAGTFSLHLCRESGRSYVPRSRGIAGEAAGLVAAVCVAGGTLPENVCRTLPENLLAALKTGAGRTDVPYTQVYNLDNE